MKDLTTLSALAAPLQVFFLEDPNLSFPGFRDDWAEKGQEFRDAKLWPGACPPVDPRVRSETWKKKQSYAQVCVVNP